MDKTNATRTVGSNIVTNQPTRKNSKSTDPLAKIRPMMPKKPQLVPTYSRANPTQITSGLKMLNTRIQSSDDPSYQPLVTISDNDNSEGEDEEDFVLPIQKLTKEELREELKIFNQTSHAALLTNNDDDDDDDTGELQFRIQQPIKRSVCCSQYPFSFKNSSCTIC